MSLVRVLGLGDGAAQVAAADAELDRDQAFALLAVDGRGAGALELAVGVRRAVLAHRGDQVAQPQPRRVAEGIGGVGQAAGDGRMGPASLALAAELGDRARALGRGPPGCW